VPGRLTPDGTVGLDAWQRGENRAFLLPLLEEEPRPHALRAGTKRGLAITLARAIIASPHSHEEASSWCSAVSIIGMPDGVNLYSPQLGARGPSSSHGGGPRALFLCAHPRGSQRGAHERGVMRPHGRRARRGDGGGRSAAGLVGDAQGVAVPRAYHPLGASDRILAGLRVQGPSQAWRVTDVQGSRSSCHPPRAARAAPVRMSCPGENEVCDGNHGDGNHDDSRVITHA
jgi:hypothetical protein